MTKATVRTNRFELRLSDEELARLTAEAASAGVRLTTLVRLRLGLHQQEATETRSKVSKVTHTPSSPARTTEAPERTAGHPMKAVVALLLTAEQITDLRAKAKKNDAIGEYARRRLKDAGL